MITTERFMVEISGNRATIYERATADKPMTLVCRVQAANLDFVLAALEQLERGRP